MMQMMLELVAKKNLEVCDEMGFDRKLLEEDKMNYVVDSLLSDVIDENSVTGFYKGKPVVTFTLDDFSFAINI